MLCWWGNPFYFCPNLCAYVCLHPLFFCPNLCAYVCLYVSVCVCVSQRLLPWCTRKTGAIARPIPKADSEYLPFVKISLKLVVCGPSFDFIIGAWKHGQ